MMDKIKDAILWLADSLAGICLLVVAIVGGVLLLVPSSLVLLTNKLKGDIDNEKC